MAEPVTKVPNDEDLLGGTTTKPDATPVLEIVKDDEVVTDGSPVKGVITDDEEIDLKPALVVTPT